MKKPLPGRVDRLEQLRGLARAGGSRATLALLEADYAQRFPLPIADWSKAQCEEFLLYQSSDLARRVDELRQQARTPAQRAADAAVRAACAKMSLEQANAYLTGGEP